MEQLQVLSGCSPRIKGRSGDVSWIAAAVTRPKSREAFTDVRVAGASQLFPPQASRPLISNQLRHVARDQATLSTMHLLSTLTVTTCS